MARSDYFSAASPEPWQVLGITLRPFSIGHYLKLRRLDCAFVADDSREAQLKDLIIGIIVCSMSSHPDPTQDEFWCWFNRTKPDSFLTRLRFSFHRRAARLLKSDPMTPAEHDIYLLGKRIGLFDFQAKVKIFRDYIEAHSRGLDYWLEPQGDGEAKKSGAHWVHSMLSIVTSKCGYDLVEAYNMSFAQCLNDYLMEAERNGVIRFMTPQESEATASSGKVVVSGQ